jgi:hypothetical protein
MLENKNTKKIKKLIYNFLYTILLIKKYIKVRNHKYVTIKHHKIKTL